YILYICKSIYLPIGIKKSLTCFDISCPTFIVLVINRRKQLLVMIAQSNFGFDFGFFFAGVGCLNGCDQCFYRGNQLNNRLVISLWKDVVWDSKFINLSDSGIACQTIISLIHSDKTERYLIKCVLWIIGILEIFIQFSSDFFI